MAKAGAKNVETLKGLTYGVEIEMSGISRRRAASVIAKHFGKTFSEIERVNNVYDIHIIRDEQGRGWTIERDASIDPERRDGTIAGDDYRVEFVTPILSYDDIPELQQIVRELRHEGARVNTSCGIHIHVGAAAFDGAKFRNLVNIMSSKEDLIYKALDISGFRTMHWCRKIDKKFLTELNAVKPADRNTLADIWYKQAPGEGRDRHYNSNRYHGLNLHATFTKGTVEFRLFNSTLHAGKIKAYIQFVGAIAAQAINQSRTTATKTETTNPAYSFRCWLLRLGLNGDEFKTARLHLMANLEGNAAWRNGAPTQRVAA